MNRVPYPVLAQIMNFLDPRSVILSFMPLNKSCLKVVQTEVYVNEYLKYILHLGLEIPLKDSIFLLKSISSNKNRKSIKILGFGTTGGMQNNTIYFWVDNMYYGKDFRNYPTLKQKFNINTVGVISNSQIKGQMRDRIRKIVPKYSHEKIYNPFTRYNNPQKIRWLWEYHYANCKSIIESAQSPTGNLERSKECIDWLIENTLSHSELKRKPDDDYVLIDPIDIESANSGKSYFITNLIQIKPILNYTRPVSAFMVFVSDVYIDIEDEVFNLFNDLKTEKDFSMFLESEFGRSFEVSPSRNERGFIYRTFSPCNKGLKPMIWANFGCRLGGISIQLEEYFCGVYLYMKLISPEPHHDVANSHMDARRIRIKGFEVNLN